jgi:hypothetical protein
MTTSAGGFVLGYHGCSRELGERVIREGLDLEKSDKSYDWLGPGVYFRENDQKRALEWSEEKVKEGKYAEPFVLGAVIDLRNCLDLLIMENIEILSVAYRLFSAQRKKAGLSLPENREPKKVLDPGDNLLRFLDCAVIRHLHTVSDDPVINPVGDGHIPPFDTVRGLFMEGKPAYTGGGFYKKTHIQIAVRTNTCIKGLFEPRG